MGFGAFAEPLVVVTLLFGGAWFNRTTAADNLSAKLANYSPLENARKRSDDYSSPRRSDSESSDTPPSVDWNSSSGTLSPLEQSRWRNRRVKAFGYGRLVSSPNTAVFKDKLLSRLLQKFPFLVEAWYWALIYWVCSLAIPWHPVSQYPAICDATSSGPRNSCLTLIFLVSFRCTN